MLPRPHLRLSAGFSLPRPGPGTVGYTSAPPPRDEGALAYSVDPSTGVIVFAPVAVEGNRR